MHEQADPTTKQYRIVLLQPYTAVNHCILQPNTNLIIYNMSWKIYVFLIVIIGDVQHVTGCSLKMYRHDKQNGDLTMLMCFVHIKTILTEPDIFLGLIL